MTMKTGFLLLLIIVLTGSCRQQPDTTYTFEVAADGPALFKATADSVITILGKRLKSAGYKDPVINYETAQRQFVVKVVSKGDDAFIRNGLVNPYEIYIRELYTLEQMLPFWEGQPAMKNAVFGLMAPPAYYGVGGSPTAEVGAVKIRDTARFNAVVLSFREQQPADCFFAYAMATEPGSDRMIKAYACRENDYSIYVNKTLSSASQNFDYGGRPCIRLTFTPFGADRFARITEKNAGRPIGILINGNVATAPNVLGKIEGGNAEISGNFTEAEAKAIAANLNSGTLPVKLRMVR